MGSMKRFAKLMLAAVLLAMLGLALPQNATVKYKLAHMHSAT
jgi:hypothetical protein